MNESTEQYEARKAHERELIAYLVEYDRIMADMEALALRKGGETLDKWIKCRAESARRDDMEI